MPIRTGLTTRKPAAGVGSIEDRLRQLEDQVGSLSGRLSRLQGPGLRPQGATNVTVTAVGTTNLISFRADVAEASGVAYRIWRAPAGTRAAPTTPSSSTAVLIGAIPAIWSRPSAAEPYIWADRDFAITQLDPANPSRYSYWVSTVTIEEESPKILAAGSPIELLTNGPGDQSSDVVGAVLNKLHNSAFINSDVTTANVNLGVRSAITGATIGPPIAITTATAHGLNTGNIAQCRRVGGNTNANKFTAKTRISVTVADGTHFSLDGITGNAAYTSGGFAYLVGGQDLPPTLARDTADNSAGWSPWYKIGGTVQFASDGTDATQEILLSGVTFATPAEAAQDVAGPKLRTGLHLTLSVFARAPVAPNDMELRLKVVTPNGTLTGVFDGSLLTTTYKRFVFNFALPSSSSYPGTDVSCSFVSALKFDGGTARDIYIMRPMLAVGNLAPEWHGTIDGEHHTNSASTVPDPQTPTWSRQVDSIIVRDASAAYA